MYVVQIWEWKYEMALTILEKHLMTVTFLHARVINMYK